MKKALISVSNKKGLLEFVKQLVELDYEIISTGGTYKLLFENGIPVKMIDEVTGFPEIMDGRVKTLHPKVHGGLLCLRNNENHLKKHAFMQEKNKDFRWLLPGSCTAKSCRTTIFKMAMQHCFLECKRRVISAGNRQ